MKKVMFLFASLAICVLSINAQTRTTDYKESTARNLEPPHSVMVAPLIADLSVIGGRIVYTEKESFAAYTVTPDVVKFVENFKKVALSRAARAHGADAIIGATVDVVTNSEGHLEITISGYPAKYTNFRNATAEDITLVQQGLNVMSRNNTDILTTPTSQTRMDVVLSK